MAGNPLVGDPQPFMHEEEGPKTVPEDALETEMAKLGNARVKWPQITSFIKERQEFYQRYLPGPKGGQHMSELSAAERGMWWLCAATMIAEYDAFMDVVNEVADAKRRQPPKPSAEI